MSGHFCPTSLQYCAPGPCPPRPPVAGWGRVGAGVPGHRAQLLIHLPPLLLVQPAAHLQWWEGEQGKLLNQIKAGTAGTPLAAPANLPSLEASALMLHAGSQGSPLSGHIHQAVNCPHPAEGHKLSGVL